MFTWNEKLQYNYICVTKTLYEGNNIPSFDLKTDLLYDVRLRGSTETQKEKEIEEFKELNFISYLSKKLQRKKSVIEIIETYASAIFLFSIGAAILFLVMTEVNSVIADGKSTLFLDFEVSLDLRSQRLYLYTPAMSTVLAIGILFLYGSYSITKPVRLTDAEIYFSQIFEEISKNGEDIEDYVIFHKEEKKSNVGYKLKKAKLGWDFQKLSDCFGKRNPLTMSLTLILTIWLGVGAFLINSLGPTDFMFYMWLLASIGAFFSFVYTLDGFIKYRSLREEFIEEQKLHIDKLYLQTERRPDDLVTQLKLSNAQTMLNRLEHTPSHPFKPLVKVVTVIPFIVGILSYLI